MHQRRVFLKVLAAGSLVGCGADPAPGVSMPGGGGGSQANGGTGTVGGGPSSGAGGTAAGGNPSTNGGSPSSNGGNATGGNGASGSPSSNGGAPSGAGTSGAPGAGGNPNPGSVVANLKDVPVGSFTIVGGIFFMGRDAGGIYAMSMQCTHKFCALDLRPNDLYCSCHFSRFDKVGKVLQGPAVTPLPYYAVYVDAATGDISVDRFNIVVTGTRTKV